MRDYIIELGQFVYHKVKNQKGTLKNRLVNGYSPGGDAQFNIDAAAEEAVLDYIQEPSGCVLHGGWRPEADWRRSAIYFNCRSDRRNAPGRRGA